MRPTSSSGWCTVVSAGTAISRHHRVVEADDGEVLGDTDPARPRLLEHRDRHLVVAGEDGRRTLGQIEELRRGGPPLDGAELSVRLERRVRAGYRPRTAPRGSRSSGPPWRRSPESP